MSKPSLVFFESNGMAGFTVVSDLSFEKLESLPREPVVPGSFVPVRYVHTQGDVERKHRGLVVGRSGEIIYACAYGVI